MKNAKFSLVVLAIVVALASAFTTKVSHKAVTKDPSFAWFDNTVTTFQDDATVVDQQTLTGCTGSINVCEKGYGSGQLNNPNDPTQGVKPDQITQPQALIFLAQ